MLEPYPLHVLSLSKNTKKRRSDYSFRDRYVYFYYDFVMKIPGIGGGGECGWLEDVPENGLCPLSIGERTPRSSFALWVMKVI